MSAQQLEFELREDGQVRTPRNARPALRADRIFIRGTLGLTSLNVVVSEDTISADCEDAN